jgi:hypothetical protein
LDKDRHFLDNTVSCIPVADYFLLGLLNSKVIWRYICEKCAILGDKGKRGRVRLKTFYVEQIPVPDATAQDRNIIAGLAERCLEAKGAGCEQWETEIDERVPKLYGLK